MRILVLSSGGGGGNILSRVQAMVRERINMMQATHPEHAAFLRDTIRFLRCDTNKFARPRGTPDDEWFQIGSSELGSGRNPDVAMQALENSMDRLKQAISSADVLVPIATLGKGTGTGTIVRICQVAREMRKLVLPHIIQAAFDSAEVSAAHHKAGLLAMGRLDELCIRFAHLRNDSLYSLDMSSQQAYDQMNTTIASGIQVLFQVFMDLNQADPADIARCFAGPGRFRVSGFDLDTTDPTESEVVQAAANCFADSHYGFEKKARMSLVSINGPWSHKIRGRITHAINKVAVESKHPDYDPIPIQLNGPKPWGVITVQTDNDGMHPPLDLDLDLVEAPIMGSSVQLEMPPLVLAATLPSQTPSQLKEESTVVVLVSESPTDRVAASVKTPVRRKRTNARRRKTTPPPSPSSQEGGSPTPTPLAGASTDSPPTPDNVTEEGAPQEAPAAAALVEVPAPTLTPEYSSFAAFVADFNRRLKKATDLVDTEAGIASIPMTADELRKAITSPFFRDLFKRFPGSLQSRILGTLCDPDPNLVARIKDWDIPVSSGHPIQLSQITDAVWARVNRGILSEGDPQRTADSTYVRKMVELYGDPVLQHLPFEVKVTQPNKIRVLFAKVSDTVADQAGKIAATKVGKFVAKWTSKSKADTPDLDAQASTSTQVS